MFLILKNNKMCDISCMTKKQYILYFYELENIDPDKYSSEKYPDLSFGERWWNGVSINVKYLNEDQILYCRGAKMIQ